jgi:Transposase IS116/IS110/IS902 family
VRHGEIRRLAHAIRAGRHALAANRAQLQAIVDQIAPGLTERRGIGAVTAAQAIVSFSHPGRCRSDAAFAALSGTSPLQASSGKTVRHRLNRGGDRAPEQRDPHHRRDPHAVLPHHQGLRRPSHGRGQVQPRDPALPQALHRPPALPRPQRQHHPHRPDITTSGGRLTNIEASGGDASGACRPSCRRLLQCRSRQPGV